MNQRKPKWPEAILTYLVTRAVPVDGAMVWVKPKKSAQQPRPVTQYAAPKSLHKPA
jgi:hypothetical protein